jgi:hypothetical protein
VAVKTCQRAPGDVASHIAAGAGSGKAHFPKALKEIGERFNRHPMKLDVLTNGDVGYAASVSLGKVGENADLLARENAVGDANTDHEVLGGFAFAIFTANYAEAVALRVDAPSAEIRADPLRRDGGVAAAGELANLVKMVPGILFAFEAIDALGFGLCDSGHGFGTLVGTPGKTWLQKQKARVTSGSGTRASELFD